MWKKNMQKNELNMIEIWKKIILIYIYYFYGQAQPTIKSKKSANKSTQNQKMNMFKIT